MAAADLPAALANGLRVRVRLETAQANGQWVAISVRSGVRKVEDRAEGRLRGLVTVFTLATNFEVGGVVVWDDYGAFECEGVATLGRQLFAAQLTTGRLVHNLNGHLLLFKLSDQPLPKLAAAS